MLRARPELSALDVDAADLVFARARVKHIRRVEARARAEERLTLVRLRRSVVSGCVFVFVDQAAE
jgi:hypothetical protein